MNSIKYNGPPFCFLVKYTNGQKFVDTWHSSQPNVVLPQTVASFPDPEAAK